MSVSQIENQIQWKAPLQEFLRCLNDDDIKYISDKVILLPIQGQVRNIEIVDREMIKDKLQEYQAIIIMQYKWLIFRENGKIKFKIKEPKDDKSVNLIIYRIKPKNADDVKFALYNVYNKLEEPNYWFKQQDQINRFLQSHQMSPQQQLKHRVTSQMQSVYPFAVMNVFIQDEQFTQGLCNLLQNKSQQTGNGPEDSNKVDLYEEFISDLKKTKDDQLCQLFCRKYKFKHSQLSNMVPFILIHKEKKSTEYKEQMLRNALLYIQMDQEEPQQFNQHCGPICTNWCVIIRDFILEHFQ